MKLCDHTIALLMEHGSLMHCPMNHILQQADQQAGNLYIVHSGRLRVFLSNEHGKELTVDVIHKGSVFGTNSFLYHGTHKVSIQSVTEARLIVCSRDTIRTLSASHPELSRDLLQYFIEENNPTFSNLFLFTVPLIASWIFCLLPQIMENDRSHIPMRMLQCVFSWTESLFPVLSKTSVIRTSSKTAMERFPWKILKNWCTVWRKSQNKNPIISDQVIWLVSYVW